jgi:hypothetical protein
MTSLGGHQGGKIVRDLEFWRHEIVDTCASSGRAFGPPRECSVV